MTRSAQRAMRTGYFGIGIVDPKRAVNMGTLWRSAASMGARFTFQIGGRYERQCSDTLKSWRMVPHFVYDDADHFASSVPYDAHVIGVEITDTATPIGRFCHPDRAIYVLGAEDHGIPNDVLKTCGYVVVLPGEFCLNVSVAGSIVMYDRLKKAGAA